MAKLIEITGKALAGEWGTDDPAGTGIPILRTTNFTNDGVVDYKDVVTRTIAKKNLNDKYLRNGDIIIEKSGGSDKQPVGRVIYYDGPKQTYLFNNFTGLLRVKDQTVWLPRYVFYALFCNYSMGGTRAYENRTTGLHNLQTDSYISSFEVPSISMQKQCEICANMDTIMHLIVLKKKQVTKLDELVKSRFVEMFGAYAAKDCTRKIGDYADVLGGYAFKSDLFCADAIPVIRISNICDGEVTLDYSTCFSKTFWEQNKRFRAEKMDIMMAMSGATTGKAGLYTNVQPALINQRVACIRARQNRARPEFLFIATQLEWMYDLIQETSAGCAQPNISGKQIESMPVPDASYELQNRFAAFVSEVDKSKLAVKQSLEKLETLKKSLMQQYFG